jgi:subtilisin family serine protease
VAARDGVSADEVRSSLAADPQVAGFEPEATARIPRVHDRGLLDQSTVVILAGLDRTPAPYFGASAWAGYVAQPAVTLIGADRARADRQRGNGVIVAVIDTGVDNTHPLLEGSLVPGYDFTRDTTDTSPEWADLNQSTVVILQRSQRPPPVSGQPPASAPNQSTVVILNQSTVVILNRSKGPVPTPSGTAATPNLSGAVPTSFGHGTMVAGLVRAVAPGARIMPLKAFQADGTASISAIVRAIHHAVDHGAKVINMSFDLDSPSEAIRRAVQYAAARGVICVSSAGNDGVETLIYPAGLKRVFGVASTTLEDTRAPFSNYGERLVDVAAPGVELITAFPGGNYAAASGTSFSAGLVSGAVAILAGLKPDLSYGEASDAFDRSVFISPDLGKGRIDIPEAVSALDLNGGEHEHH